MKFRLVLSLAKAPIFLLLLLWTTPSSGQNGNLILKKSFSNTIDRNGRPVTDLQAEYIRNFYSSSIETPNQLINGKEYASYYTRSKIKPLLFSEKTRSASIFTRTRRYNNLTLQYDTYLDEVIYTDTSRTINFIFPQIALNKDIVDGFGLYFDDDSIIFRNFRDPESAAFNIKEGFYEVAYEGKSELIIKHESSFYEREGLNNYKYSPEYYIKTGSSFSKFHNKKSLLRLFGEKSDDVNGFLKTARVRIRKADKIQIIQILKFYDSLLTAGR